jgi:hypothetical protein
MRHGAPVRWCAFFRRPRIPRFLQMEQQQSVPEEISKIADAILATFRGQEIKTPKFCCLITEFFQRHGRQQIRKSPCFQKSKLRRSPTPRSGPTGCPRAHDAHRGPYLGSLIASGREPLPHSGNMFFRSSVARKSANTRIRALSRLWAWRRTKSSAQCSGGTSNVRTSVMSRSHK